MASTSSHLKQRVYADEHGSYQLPKDALEHDRLDRQSAAFVALMNQRPFHAPVANPTRILDIGCGTGSMTNLPAATFPEATVIGVDIAPVPESRYDKRKNVEYVQGDIRELVGSDPRLCSGSFDYVFQRLLLFGMTDWTSYISTISRLLKPGGWVEAQEGTCALRSQAGEDISNSWWHYPLWREDAVKLGLDIEIAEKLRGIFESTESLQKVNENIYKFAGEAREEAPRLSGLEGQMLPLFTLVMRKTAVAAGRRPEEVDAMLADLNDKWANGLPPESRFAMYAVVSQRKLEDHKRVMA